MLKDIIGHKEIVNYFERVIDNDALSHAYCFIGMEHLGKKHFAKLIASALLATKVEKLSTHPDYIEVKQEMDEKKKKTKKVIEIEQIRKLINTMRGLSLFGGYKIAIIDQAEKIHTSAANAFLKTLEEPGSKKLIFLITSNDEALPQTILSRSQSIYFKPVRERALFEYLKNEDVELSKISEMVKFSRGLPGLIRLWLRDDQEFEEYKSEIVRFKKLLYKPYFEKLKIIDDLFGDKSDRNLAGMRLINILNLWQILWRDIGLKTSAIDRCLFLSVFDLINEAKLGLSANIHPKILLSKILIKLP